MAHTQTDVMDKGMILSSNRDERDERMPHIAGIGVAQGGKGVALLAQMTPQQDGAA